MNLHTALLAPWRASKPAAQWVALVLMVLTVFGAIAAAMYAHKTDPWIVAAAITGVGEAFIWAFMMSNTVLLAIDARQLRLPGVQRSVVIGVLLYGLLGVALPTAVLSAFGGRAEVIATLIAMCCLAGFVFALLPQFLGMLAYFVPMLLQALPSKFHLPGPSSADFIDWAVPAVVGLLLLAMASWRWLLHAANPYKPGLGQPMVMQFRFAVRRTGSGSWGTLGGGMDSIRLIRARPNWMQRKVDLRGCGPGRPLRSFRVALGGLFMPLTVMSWLRQLAFVLVPCLFFMLLLSLQDPQQQGMHGLIAIWHDINPIMLVWFGGFGSMMLAFLCLMQLGRSWQKPNAELPLLALLPGLDANRQGKRDLLRASLLPPLRMQFSLLVVLLAICIGLHLGYQAALFVLLSQLGGIGFVVAFTLAIIGGYSLPPWVIFASGMLGCILINVSLFTPTLTDVSKISLHAVSLLGFLLVAWGVLAVWLLWLGRRGWLGLQRLPHPFLPN